MEYLFAHSNGLEAIDKHPTAFNGPVTLNGSAACSTIWYRLKNVQQFSLGELDGTSLSFTDVCNINHEYPLYLAVAEENPDAMTNGANKGSKVGLKPAQPTSSVLHSIPFRYAYGRPFTKKAEGLTMSLSSGVKVQSSHSVFGYVVVDTDGPNILSMLYFREFKF